MKPDVALGALARAHGIFPEYTDMQGAVHQTTPETQRAMLRADGLTLDSPADIHESLRAQTEIDRRAYAPDRVVMRSGQPLRLEVQGTVAWHLIAETTGQILAEGKDQCDILLPALPDGLHDLHMSGVHGTQEICVIVAPARAPSVEAITGSTRVWGIMAALYGLKSDPPKHLPDFNDLAWLAEGAGQQSASFVGINPVHALGAATDASSPYSPTHRGFLNTDHIAVAPVPDLDAAPDRVDYAAHRDWHRQVLEQEFAAFQKAQDSKAHAAFEAFRSAGGDALRSFAQFEALSVVHGPDNRRWPAISASAETVSPETLAFHMWLQWRAEAQLSDAHAAAKKAGMALGLYLDLAVGARLGGAESWGAETAAAPGVSLGAPPDHLSPAGQNWQLSALSPRRLRAGKYEAFRFILRQNMRFCGLLRIDHALGLYRSFWLPEDGSPGGYIQQDLPALLAIIMLEAQRAGTVVVGEDLGLVPAGFRDKIASAGLYGYSVLQYEKDASDRFLPANQLRPQSLACFGTHDTPTLEGFWQGRDIRWWEKLGWITSKQAARAATKRADEKRQLAQLPAPAPLPHRAGPGLRDHIHAELAQSPAALVAVQLDDILCLKEAQNLPGTVAEHPNWCRVYPKTVDEIAAGADLKKTAAIMAHAGRISQK